MNIEFTNVLQMYLIQNKTIVAVVGLRTEGIEEAEVVAQNRIVLL